MKVVELAVALAEPAEVRSEFVVTDVGQGQGAAPAPSCVSSLGRTERPPSRRV